MNYAVRHRRKVRVCVCVYGRVIVEGRSCARTRGTSGDSSVSAVLCCRTVHRQS